VFLTLTLLATAAGFLAGHAIVLPMLWRTRRALRTARHDATHDDVTGLPNRRALLAHLAAARRDGDPVAVAMIDLDHFLRTRRILIGICASSCRSTCGTDMADGGRGAVTRDL
jgi:hypothetical protein